MLGVFVAAASAGTLPAVSFVKPDGIDNEHPNYTDVINGEAHTLELINAVRNGPNWADTAIVVTYDENEDSGTTSRPSRRRLGTGDAGPDLHRVAVREEGVHRFDGR